MNEKDTKDTDEINLLDLIVVILKRKKLILGITLAAASITALISLVIPPVYRAETRILPSKLGGSSAIGLLSQISGMSDLSFGALGIKTTEDLYIGMLKSRTIADRIIDRFDLMKLYDTESREDARNILGSALKVSTDKKSGIITIGIEDKDPKRAAEMANAFVEELKNLTKGLAITEASQRRLFFEEQLKEVREALAKAEEDFRSFQERTGALEVKEQAKAVIESIANLRAQIAAKEVQLKVMRTYLTPNNPELKKAEEELKALRAELSKLEASGANSPDPLIPTGKVPKVSTEYARKLRELKYYETLYELLSKQYEIARLDESKDAVLIQVIDKAIPPEKRVKPKRKLMVAVATLTGFFTSVLLAFFIEYIQNASRSPENRERIEAIKSYMTFRQRKV